MWAAADKNASGVDWSLVDYFVPQVTCPSMVTCRSMVTCPRMVTCPSMVTCLDEGEEAGGAESHHELGGLQRALEGERDELLGEHL